MDVVIVELLAGVLHAFCRQQHFRGPGNILMTQARLKMEAVIRDKLAAVNIEPGDMQELTKTPVDCSRSSGKIGWISFFVS